jgi:hypothetical protein
MAGEEEAHMKQEDHMEEEAHVEEDGFEDNSGEEEEGAPQGGGQQQQVNYRLVEFLFYLDSFLYEVTNSIFSGCDTLS